jgi:hypothetical protein
MMNDDFEGRVPISPFLQYIMLVESGFNERAAFEDLHPRDGRGCAVIKKPQIRK